jgi:hypothetical protein
VITEGIGSGVIFAVDFIHSMMRQCNVFMFVPRLSLLEELGSILRDLLEVVHSDRVLIDQVLHPATPHSAIMCGALHRELKTCKRPPTLSLHDPYYLTGMRI